MASVLKRVAERPVIPSWTDGIDWRNWSRHESYLRSQTAWKPHQVDSVLSESLRILRKTTPLTRSEFQCRGLVVGYVQSGKTANFTAVAARAADVGYRLIIVLSGIHDSLREQTQARLNRELVGVGEDWITLTDGGNDFQVPPNPDGFSRPGTVLIVAKKIVPVLTRIDKWLELVGARLDEVPMMVIDDESDQASVNTRGNRRDPAVSATHEDERTNPNTAPTLTNALIRSILGKARKATYIAYTATPFANLFINPDAYDREVGEDLFPRDFVVQLPRPDGYTGTEELFGVAAHGREVLRPVAREDAVHLRSRRRRGKGAPIVVQESQQLPQSLCDALLSFCVAGAIRSLRGIEGKPHTMLVHVSHEQRDQIRIGSAIAEQIQAWRNSEEVQPGSMRNPMLSAWHDFGTVSLPEGATEECVVDEAIRTLRILDDVAVLNSTTGEDLRYDERPSCHLIAVGGNRLSRGLTLEGLTIAYFLRTTTMVDSLLQMCRWYGFRGGYGDLIRIWTTREIADWFVELSVVEQSLRDSIVRLEREGKRPDQMQVAVRAHGCLALTSTVKSRMAEDVRRSWSSQCPQTILLPLEDAAALRNNVAATDEILAAHPPTVSRYGGALAYDVPAEAIVSYLRSYRSHPLASAFIGSELADWVERRNKAGELSNWTVFVASPDRNRQVLLGGRSYGLVERSPTGGSGIGILVDPRHEGVDLPNGPDAYRRGNSLNAHAMRASRQPTNGLLLIYPLDPVLLGARVETVVALAASLPKTCDESESYIANRGVPRG